MSFNPSDKQVRYAFVLLEQNGFATRYMNARFRELGATMRERSGTVEHWLRSRTPGEMAALIDQLKAMKQNGSDDQTGTGGTT